MSLVNKVPFLDPSSRLSQEQNESKSVDKRHKIICKIINDHCYTFVCTIYFEVFPPN